MSGAVAAARCEQQQGQYGFQWSVQIPSAFLSGRSELLDRMNYKEVTDRPK